MLSVDCRLRQRLSLQTGGSSVTRKFRSSDCRHFYTCVFCSSTPKSYRNDLRSMEVARMLHIADFSDQSPRNVEWTLPWHNILHTWKERIRGFTTPFELGTIFCNTTSASWIKRVRAWQPEGQRRIGRPKYSWDSMITIVCHLKSLP